METEKLTAYLEQRLRHAMRNYEQARGAGRLNDASHFWTEQGTFMEILDWVRITDPEEWNKERPVETERG